MAQIRCVLGKGWLSNERSTALGDPMVPTPSEIPDGQHFDQNVSYISLPQNVNLSTCHTSQKVDTLTKMFPTYHCLKMSTCQHVTHPRRSTLWSEFFLHVTASKCWTVDMSHIPEGRHFYQKIFPTYHCLEMLTCWYVKHPRMLTLWAKCFLHLTTSKCRPVNMSHVPEGWDFDQYVSYISLPRNVNLSTCHTSQKVNTLTRMFHYLELSTC